jgi:hypothetical protein
MSAKAMSTSAGPPKTVGQPATEETQQHATGTKDARDTRKSRKFAINSSERQFREEKKTIKTSKDCPSFVR